jgi:hypothetical protein
MKKIIYWSFLSIPTLIAFTYEAFSWNRTALFFYQFPLRFNYPPAQYNAGTMYVIGQGITPNFNKGKSLIEASANAGYPPAIRWYNEHGRVVPPDPLEGDSIADLAASMFKYTQSPLMRIIDKLKPIVLLAIHIIILYEFVLWLV